MKSLLSSFARRSRRIAIARNAMPARIIVTAPPISNGVDDVLAVELGLGGRLARDTRSCPAVERVHRTARARTASACTASRTRTCRVVDDLVHRLGSATRTPAGTARTPGGSRRPRRRRSTCDRRAACACTRAGTAGRRGDRSNDNARRAAASASRAWGSPARGTSRDPRRLLSDRRRMTSRPAGLSFSSSTNTLVTAPPPVRTCSSSLSS